jgi:hypothetical protein
VAVEILAAAEALPIPAAVDLAAIVIGALTGGLLAASWRWPSAVGSGAG